MRSSTTRYSGGMAKSRPRYSIADALLNTSSFMGVEAMRERGKDAATGIM